jgi:hypothetical protein
VGYQSVRGRTFLSLRSMLLIINWPTCTIKEKTKKNNTGREIGVGPIFGFCDFINFFSECLTGHAAPCVVFCAPVPEIYSTGASLNSIMDQIVLKLQGIVAGWCIGVC